MRKRIKTKMEKLSFAAMFKKITALVFMLAFVAQTFSAPFILLDYYTNTGAYAKNCINKARPKLHCNGKCQMMKKMKEEERKEQDNAEQRSGAKLEVLSTRSFYPAINIPAYSDIAAVMCGYHPCGMAIDRSYDFFHPPKA